MTPVLAEPKTLKQESLLNTKNVMVNRKHFALAIALCFISAVLLILSFPKFELWFLAWVGLVPLFFAIENKKPLIAFTLSYLTGIIFFWGVIYWLVHVSLIGLVLLVLYLALYFGIFGFLISRYSLLSTCYSLVSIPSLWIIFEYLRAHLFTGFGWALLSYSQYRNLTLIQICDIVGGYGISFLIVMVNIAIFDFFRKPKPKKIKLYFFLTTSVLIISLCYGFFKLAQTTNSQRIKISVIQGNIPQDIKWDEMAWPYILDKYIELSKNATIDSPDLIIWPETAFPGYFESTSIFLNKLINLAKELKCNLLIGAITWEDPSIYNSAILISSQGELIETYHKLHLVPFGEYVPFRRLFSFLPQLAVLGDFTAGKEYTIFQIPQKFSTIICFEDTVPELSKEFVRRGAQLLVNITNDAWFKDTSAPYQHLQASVFRAIENNVPLVRVANTGVSCFIDSKGRIMGMVRDKLGKETFVEGYKTQEISLGKGITFYSQFGDIFILVCFIYLFLSVVLRRIKRNI